jgi:hypothetical protein
MKKPTERLTLPEVAQDAPISEHLAQMDAVRDFGRALVARDVPSVFEVWFPKTTDADFDVLVFDPDTATIATAPPYTDTEFWDEAA